MQGGAAAELVGRALGDDVDHAAGCAVAVAGRSRATQHFDVVDGFGRHPVHVAPGVSLAPPAVAHRLAAVDRLAVDEDQRVLVLSVCRGQVHWRR